jgi:hypothetical protein
MFFNQHNNVKLGLEIKNVQIMLYMFKNYQKKKFKIYMLIIKENFVKNIVNLT